MDVNRTKIGRPKETKIDYNTVAPLNFEFHMVHYQTMLNKYAYHRILLCLLEKHKCKRLIRFFSRNNVVMIECDFAEEFKAEL